MWRDDSEQLHDVIRQVDNYMASPKNSTSNLLTLINELEVLQNTLPNFNMDWEREFMDKLADLESVYSYALEHNISELKDNSDLQIVNSALIRVKVLIMKRIHLPVDKSCS